MSNTREQIYRAGVTPVWGLSAGLAQKSEAVGLLVTSANLNHNTKTYVQVDSEGRDAGVLSYDDSIGMTISGNVVYAASGTGGMAWVTNNFTPGKAVENCTAKCMLEMVRIMDLNETAAAGSKGTYFVNSVSANQTNTDAVSVDLDITYYGFDA